MVRVSIDPALASFDRRSTIETRIEGGGFRSNVALALDLVCEFGGWWNATVASEWSDVRSSVFGFGRETAAADEALTGCGDICCFEKGWLGYYTVGGHEDASYLHFEIVSIDVWSDQ